MQNLMKYPKYQYGASRSIFNCIYEHNVKGVLLDYNLRCRILNHSTGVEKSLSSITDNIFNEHSYTSFLRNSSKIASGSRTWGNIRNFSTTSVCMQGNADNKPKGPSGSSNKNQDERDKKPNDNEDKSDELSTIRDSILNILAVLLLFSLVRHFQDGRKDIEQEFVTTWNEFVHQMLEKGEVKEVIVKNPSVAVVVLHEGAIFRGRVVPPKSRYLLQISNVDTFEPKIRKLEQSLGIKPGNSIQITYERSLEYWNYMIQIFFLLGTALMFFLLRKKYRAINPFDFFYQLKSAKFTLIDPLTGKGKGVRFEDVAGLKQPKIEVMEFVDYLKNPERYKTLGAKVPKGALLLGPPGCGKTLLAKALATEANVPFLSMNGSEFIEVFGGLGAARVRDLFKEGRKRAPSIIYIDELDAIGKKRSGYSSLPVDNEADSTLNQLLVEMDGLMTKGNVIVLASTNRPQILDKALLRPGRFDRHISIDLPTQEERKQIFETHLSHLSLEQECTTYSDYLAYLTPGFSGADIANVCNEAALHAATNKKKLVDGSDLMYAVDKVIGGTVKKTNVVILNEKRITAYREAGHALVGWLLEYTDSIVKVSIVPRTKNPLGFRREVPGSEVKNHSKDELFQKMCMYLGGRVAESVMFNKVTTGAVNDLKIVTELARLQVQEWGMSPAVGMVSFPEKSNKLNAPYSKMMANLMDMEIRRIIADAYTSTTKLLTENKEKLTLIAESLLEKETLTYDDIEKLIGPPPFPKKRLVIPTEFEVIGSNKFVSSTTQPIST